MTGVIKRLDEVARRRLGEEADPPWLDDRLSLCSSIRSRCLECAGLIWSGEVVSRSVMRCEVDEWLRSGRGGGVGLIKRDSEKGKEAKSEESPPPAPPPNAGDSSIGSA